MCITDRQAVNLLFKVDQYRMQPELQNGIDLFVVFLFNLRKASIFQGFSTRGFSQMALAPERKAKRIWESCR